MRFVIILCFSLFSLNAFSQEFANKDFYLIDSLQLKELSVKSKRLIDASLTKYKQVKHDTLKLNALKNIVNKISEQEINHKYNEWVKA